MLLITLKNGKAELRKSSGSLVRTIGNGDVVYAELNAAQDLVLLTLANGKVELRKESGSLVRTLGGDVAQARWHGDDLAFTTRNGKTELRKQSGSLIRTI
jgi:hypothetical protein